MFFANVFRYLAALLAMYGFIFLVAKIWYYGLSFYQFSKYELIGLLIALVFMFISVWLTPTIPVDEDGRTQTKHL